MSIFEKIPADTFTSVQMGSSFLTLSFDPATGVGEPAFATSGGITFSENPTWVDFGDDIDNCPKNTVEGKRKTAVAPKISGTAKTINADVVAALMAAATTTSYGNGGAKLTPSLTLRQTDFKDIWIVGAYGINNNEATDGLLAIHLMNALNTAGFQWSSSSAEKGSFAFEFEGHVSMATPTVLPYEIYIAASRGASQNSVSPSSTPRSTPTGDNK